MKTLADRTLHALSSYALACTLLVLLLILTFLGTLEQVEHGIYDVQKKYFESYFLVHHLFDRIPLLLPGAYPLLVLLTINLTAGGIIRIRKRRMTLGVIIAHIGIIVMLVAGFVNFKFAQYGHMSLFEEERADFFVSYHDWEVVVSKAVDDGPVTEYAIPGEAFYGLGETGTATFTSDALPFDLTLHGYWRNSWPMPKGPNTPTDMPIAEDWYLKPQPLEKEAEMNLAGTYATVTEKATGMTHEAILWGSPAALPLAVDIDGALWGIDLRKKRWQLPFTIQLDEFIHETHPGTRIAAAYISDVTKFEDGNEQKIRIQMNEPLRHAGYTFFQASFGTRQGEPDGELFSTFAVVRNPSDQWPLYSCIIIGIGLVVHFGQKLLGYIRAQNTRMA